MSNIGAICEKIEDNSRSIYSALQGLGNNMISITTDDLAMTKKILNSFSKLMYTVRSFEFCEKEIKSKGITMVIESSPQSIQMYETYKGVTSLIEMMISSLPDPHERLICELLFVEGKKYNMVTNYIERGYRADILPISHTTMAERRRSAIKTMARNLKSMGLLTTEFCALLAIETDECENQ